ncbi:uncharacterized protein TNCV_3473431 [Trichonephila clavipes]|nr:uncharacterized protein TNCV_3473431 [Trichonephila clavipes]
MLIFLWTILLVAVRAFLQQNNLNRNLYPSSVELACSCINGSNFDVSNGDVSLTIPDETKALGLLWRPQKDTLVFSVSSIADVSDSSTITKRPILSATARIFDPLGLILPVVTKAKLVMQELWGLKLDWNDSLPIHLETQWKRFVKFLAAINKLNIPRYILLDDALRIELHGYCDSSLRAY